MEKFICVDSAYKIQHIRFDSEIHICVDSAAFPLYIYMYITLSLS